MFFILILYILYPLYNTTIYIILLNKVNVNIVFIWYYIRYRGVSVIEPKNILEIKNFGEVRLEFAEYIDKHGITRNKISDLSGIKYSIVDSIIRIIILNVWVVSKIL